MPTYQLPFHKLQGAGNDFVVLDLLTHPLPADFDFPAAALRLCDRHFGVGADGLLTLEASSDSSHARMRMWNPDGTEDMCGNGLRCVAALAWRQKHVTHSPFVVQTLAGPRHIEVINQDLIRAAMGTPIFEPAQIPVLLPTGTPESVEWTIRAGNRDLVVTSLSTGSTHTVIFLDQPLSETDFQTLSPILENHPSFPERTSLMWAVREGDDSESGSRFKIRIWERGAGETLACGTGACAVAVAAQVTGRAERAVEVESRGGVLQVEWKPGEEIFLTGPAKHVFEGVFSDELQQ
jgi:diaminopimelate epimerase